LTAALGRAKPVWDQLQTDMAEAGGVDRHEWKCHSPKWGWSLRLLRKKRTILWLSPSTGYFQVAFILGDKAMQATRSARLPKRIVALLSKAPKYPEGTGVRIDVRSARDLPALKILAAIKR